MAYNTTLTEAGRANVALAEFQNSQARLMNIAREAMGNGDVAVHDELVRRWSANNATTGVQLTRDMYRAFETQRLADYERRLSGC